MSTTPDELAGVVDLFGALTRAELSAALVELAFKQGTTVDEDAIEETIDDAIATYLLVEYEPPESTPASNGPSSSDASGEPLLVVGPTAFPALPANAEDLPHILDYERRQVDRTQVAEQVHERLVVEAERAVAYEDVEQAGQLLDVSYDIDAWAAVETDEIRASLSTVLPQD